MQKGVRNAPDGSTTCLLDLEAKGHISPGTDITHIREAGEEPLALLVGEHRLELCRALEVIHCHVQTAQVGSLRYYQLKLGLGRENKGAQHQYTVQVCEESYRKETGQSRKTSQHILQGVCNYRREALERKGKHALTDFL